MEGTVIREALAGYAMANEVVEGERVARLQQMTLDEARAIWRDLVAGWEAAPQTTDGLERLAMWRVETLVAVRQAFEKVAHARGLL